MTMQTEAVGEKSGEKIAGVLVPSDPVLPIGVGWVAAAGEPAWRAAVGSAMFRIHLRMLVGAQVLDAHVGMVAESLSREELEARARMLVCDSVGRLFGDAARIVASA